MTPRDYYRTLLVCALQRATGARTAADLRDCAIGLALDHGAEPVDVAGLTHQATAACFRWLLEVGRARKAGYQRSARHGRGEPLYILDTAEAEIAVPSPPRHRSPTMQIARITSGAAESHGRAELEFYKAFAIDAARLLVQVERLLQDLRSRQAPEYHDILRGGSCEG